MIRAIDNRASFLVRIAPLAMVAIVPCVLALRASDARAQTSQPDPSSYAAQPTATATQPAPTGSQIIVTAPPASATPTASAAVTATAAPSASASASSSANAPPKKEGHLEVFLAGGWQYHNIFGLGTTGPNINGGFGGRTANDLGVHLLIGYDFGKTADGLKVETVRVGVDMEMILDRFRFGGCGHIAHWQFTRVSATSGSPNRLGFGVCGLASADLIQFGDQNQDALYLGVRLDLELAYPTGVWGPAGYAGLRF